MLLSWGDRWDGFTRGQGDILSCPVSSATVLPTWAGLPSPEQLQAGGGEDWITP